MFDLIFFGRWEKMKQMVGSQSQEFQIGKLCLHANVFIIVNY